MTPIHADSRLAPLAEPTFSSSVPAGCDDSRTRVGVASPFELLLSQQIDLKAPQNRDTQDVSSVHDVETRKSRSTASHQFASIPTDHIDALVASSFGNSVTFQTGYFGDLKAATTPSEVAVIESNPVSNELTVGSSLIDGLDQAIIAKDLQVLGSDNGSFRIGRARDVESNQDFQLLLVSEFTVEFPPALESVDQSSVPTINEPRFSDGTSVGVENKISILEQRDTTSTTDSNAASLTTIPPTNSTPVSNVGNHPPISEQLASAVTDHLQEESISGPITVRIRLDRQDLGTVSLHLTINNNIVSIRIVTENPLARQIIDCQMNDLRQTLTEGGVTCGQFQVACDSDGQQSSGQRRPPSSTIAIGPASSSRWSRAAAATTLAATPEGRLNFVA